MLEQQGAKGRPWRGPTGGLLQASRREGVLREDTAMRKETMSLVRCWYTVLSPTAVPATCLHGTNLVDMLSKEGLPNT
jgi:hypothetical protein